MLEKIATASLVAGASATAATAASVDSSLWFIPVIVACAAAVFARITAIFAGSQKKKKVWAYELSLICSCVILSGALAVDKEWTIGMAAMYGGGIGALGSGLNSFLKSFAVKMLTSFAASLTAVVSPPPDDPKA